jgi:hypothetical protein
MPDRGEVELAVSFGPASTPLLPTAVAFARRHADLLEQVGPRSWVASFRLGTEEDRYGRALQLVGMVHGWRSTTFDLGGSPEPGFVVRSMLSCARDWLRTKGRCGAGFGSRLAPKCRGCALLDPHRALESCPPGPSLVLEERGWVLIAIPDTVPPEWGDPAGDA